MKTPKSHILYPVFLIVVGLFVLNVGFVSAQICTPPDGFCDALGGEDATNCPADCVGAPPPPPPPVGGTAPCGGVTGTCRSGGCLSGEVPDNLNGYCTDTTQDCCVVTAGGGGGAGYPCSGVTGTCRLGGCLSGEMPDNVNGWCANATDDCCVIAGGTSCPCDNDMLCSTSCPCDTNCTYGTTNYGSCTASGVAGNCIDVTFCSPQPPYKSTAGLCPGGTNIRCCTYAGGGGTTGGTPQGGTPPGGGSGSGIVPCGPGTGGPTECTLCLLLKLVQNIINFLINVSFGLAAIMLLFSVFLFFTAAGNPQKIQQAKGVLSTALIGIIIVLTAWTVINTLVLFFTNTTGWYNISC